MIDENAVTAAPTYSELLQQPEWQEFRNKILSRDNHECFICQSTSSLNVHHRQYQKEGGQLVMPWAYDTKYLITLCSDCHSFGHLHFKIPVFNR
jgi:5-methylcytosine-specific restriction endonuclease McrA